MPILVLSVLSFVFLRIEERTAKVLRASHFVGDRIEKIWARRARTALAPTRRRPSKDAEQRNLDEGWSEFGEAEREAGDDPDARDPIGFFSALACEFDPSRTHARILVKLYLFTGVTAGVGALCACIGLTFGATAELTTAAAIVLAVILLVIDVLLCWLAWRFWTGKRGMEGGDPA